MGDLVAYCSWADAQLNQDGAFSRSLPIEIRSLILQSTPSQYLGTVASLVRSPEYSDALLPLYKPLLADLVAKWTVSSSGLNEAITTVSCLARVLPLATYLLPHFKTLLRTDELQNYLLDVGRLPTESEKDVLLPLLLALFRVLSFDRDALAEIIGPLFFSSYLRHPSPPVRYLAVQNLCMNMHFTDAYSEKLVGIYVGKEAIWGEWERKEIDYRLLKLWEEKRWATLAKAMTSVEASWALSPSSSAPTSRILGAENLSPETVNFAGVLHTRFPHRAPETPDSAFVLTTTAKQNLKRLGKCLSRPTPILITGQASSGKTALVREAARLLHQSSTMITLHLNEQTDAKSLLGVHTSSADGNSFIWQPGVLTKAMQQGRWVLVEDIDRAPNEVLGLLRPILESGELFLPSRKEKIIPKDGFRVLATMKTSGQASSSLSRPSWLLNPRVWSTIETSVLCPEEIEALLRARYPTADVFITMIMRSHQNLLQLYETDHSLKGLQTRKPTLRDLLNLSRRIVHRLHSHSLVSESTVLPEQTKLDIFQDSVDCYAGNLNSERLHQRVAESLAVSMDISPQQMEHCLNEAMTTVTGNTDLIKIGRNTLRRTNSRRHNPNRKPFSLTTSARRTLDRIAAAAEFSEPCLLVGETGVGKTTMVQHVASLVGQILTVVNLSQQSEAGDLVGGLKPVTTQSLVLPMVEKFKTLFDDTFSAKRNEKFHIAVAKAVAKHKWPRLLVLWQEAIQTAATSLKGPDAGAANGSVPPSKKRKLETKYDILRKRWSDFSDSLKQIRAFVDSGKPHAFAFVEGRLVQAVREGEWVLLDEINLAPSDTLDQIVSLLQHGTEGRPSLLLAEAGNIETISAHPNFRLFAAMNPATDTGKKDLPPALRSRFTEIYVSSGDNKLDDLVQIIQTYLGSQLDNDKRAALDLARSYLALKELNAKHQLTDGAGETPHFSIRSLVRCLLYVSQHGATHGLRRAMYEGFSMSFFTVLSRASESLATPHLETHLLSNIKNRKSFFSQKPKIPHDGENFVSFRHHMVKRGPMAPDSQPHYIRTPSVERNLLNLARAASMRRFPILLQGPTSAGKTSMIEYLAKLSGNKSVRINNHEHTDLQEYLGSYISDTDGNLVFREGVLVDALRLGHWIVLDELNLAPSDVLEALNRLLDDNRELLIPETQEVVRPHPNFMLFATQNPAGLYGGRKRLSRAFRNRFLELHFDEIPEEELQVILRERSQIAPSFCAKIVAVYKSLSLQRQSSRLFEQRNSFATLRDLFRWASRPVDDRESLAYHGFMLLAERVREPAERAVVKSTLEKEIKVTLDEKILYSMSKIPDSALQVDSIVWTPAMRRLFVLISEALKNKEPVLLVGETGCGKTQICQVVAKAFGRPLDIYNAHTNTETGDLIGSQRPIRNHSELANQVQQSWRALVRSMAVDPMQEDLRVDQIIEEFSRLDKANFDTETVKQVRSSIGAFQALFAWTDGSLVRAMRRGEFFLLDEISLAEDSVLERLNSVLEPSRTILLAEKGSMENLVVADPEFQFLATMNPGGDYGKRELSAALRNRLTEIWVSPLSQEADIFPIVQKKLVPIKRHLAEKMLKFANWFRDEFHSSASKSVALRDLLAWAEFINNAESLIEDEAFLHGAFMVYVDSVGANPAGLTSMGATNLTQSRQKCLGCLQHLVHPNVVKHYQQTPKLLVNPDQLIIGSFSLDRTNGLEPIASDLVFDAPTTLQNTMRIVRALQMTRPILLEGSPGVGKTAIVTALAQACGRQFTRINLSDQTDLMDLFGADAPSEDEELGHFCWQDGPLLKAMQCGGWVLLDEMNLASQSVLEGLNACLDHRREVYVAELDKSFSCHPNFTLFAAQNPHHQGGGRKGLPASFVNRFTVVYADSFQEADFLRICQSCHPQLDVSQLETLVRTIKTLDDTLAEAPVFAQGGPWELNLRDINRWLQICKSQPNLSLSYHFRTIATERFRTAAQKEKISKEADRLLGGVTTESFYNNLTESSLQIGTAFLSRSPVFQACKPPNSTLSVHQLPAGNSIITAIRQNWPVILTGPSGAGKTTLIRHLAAVAGVELVEFSMNADVDAMDLVGGFEQFDARRDTANFHAQAMKILRQRIAESLEENSRDETRIQPLFRFWHHLNNADTQIEDICSALSSQQSLLPEMINSAKVLLKMLQSVDGKGFRFVWNDGILVDAVEKGSWLVLDNANLCNPSVLDRLNSLLEPGGLLTISEQHNGREETRVIKPHPNFRVFMTVDPRYGELSRAMRNRSLEVSLPDIYQEQGDAAPIKYALSATVSRFRQLSDMMNRATESNIIQATLGNLYQEDMAVISNFDRTLAKIQAPDAFHTELSLAETFNMLRISQISAFSPLAADPAFPQLATLNEPLLLVRGYLNPQNTNVDFPELFTRCWYLVRQLAEIESVLKNASARIMSLGLGLKDMTVLERSASASMSQKDSGALPNVVAFAQSLGSIISAAFQVEMSDKKLSELLRASEKILTFAQALLAISDKKTIDTDRLTAYMQVGSDLSGPLELSFPKLALAYLRSLKTLSTHENNLTTGFGLQLMWPIFRPQTPGTLRALRIKIALEDLVARFDRVCRFLSQPRKSLSAVRSNFRRTYISIVESEQPESSLQVLEQAVSELEVQSKKGFFVAGNFVSALRFIRGVIFLQQQELVEPDLELLIMFTPESDVQLPDAQGESPIPRSLAQLGSIDGKVLSQEGSIGIELFQALSSVHKQPLGMLNHAKEELQVLAKMLASHTDLFENLTEPVVANIRVILGGILHSLRECMTEEAKACVPVQGSPEYPRLASISSENVIKQGQRYDSFRDVYARYIYPLVMHLNVNRDLTLEQIKTCLINLSITGLMLMVPNTLFDPAMYPNVVHNLHERQISELSSKIEGQKRYHKYLTGQEASLVIRNLEKQLHELGRKEPPPAVTRPGREELIKLQEVFTTVASVILNGRTTAGHKGESAGSVGWIEHCSSDQGRSNLNIIIQRLENAHPAHDDFAKPILWFLKCLSLGLELEASKQDPTRSNDDFADHCLMTTPLLSATAATAQDWRMSKASPSNLKLRWLEHAGLKAALTQKQDTRSAHNVLEVLDSFYYEWKSRLTQDQEEAVKQSRYYTYRGDSTQAEANDDREVSEMFPNYDNDDLQPDSDDRQTEWDARATAVKLGILHQKIYSVQDPQEAMRSFIHSIHDILPGSVHAAPFSPKVSLKELLPAIFLQMDSKIAELDNCEHTRGFNIYTSPDISESQKLFDLVHQIQSRFYAIQERWPEHAVPTEVLSFCTEVLHLSFGDPLAKLLTKTEKLYEITCQWQSVASKEWSVEGFVEKMSSLIISWRRLELLSWSRLLDDEKERHNEDAQAWYLIAYEAVIHSSTKIDPEVVDVHTYQKTLVKTLEEFLRSTTLGQYSARLRLLDTLNKTLRGIAGTQNHLLAIAASVQDIIDHYKRYEAGVDASLKTGRIGLEKALREQITLASWKDTNVTALRESARRSHHKLFKIVRKYRELLNQAVVLAPPEEQSRQISEVAAVEALPRLQLNEDRIVSAIEQCRQSIPNWDERPERLVKSFGAARSMQHLYMSKSNHLQVQDEIASFRQDLSSSIKDLRTQTPAAMTEDNAAFVRHLQARKRRLLADTLKVVAHMGIRRNLPTAELEKQASTSAILAFSPGGVTRSSQITSSGDGVFHDILDTMAPVRAARTDHSDDLTDGDVNRCVGFLEGLLSLIIHQRQAISNHAIDLDAFGSQLALLQSVAFVSSDELRKSTSSIDPVHAVRDRLDWIAEILVTCSHILKFQARHSNLDVEELLETMQGQSSHVKELKKLFHELSEPPPGMAWKASSNLVRQTLDFMSQMTSHLRDWQRREPRVKYLVSKIIVWTEKIPIDLTEERDGLQEVSLERFDHDLKDAMDQIFVALQRLSAMQPEMPKSDEDPGWLIQANKHTSEAVRSLQVRTIVERLDQCLTSRLQCLSPASFRSAQNLLVVALPIIEQFFHICHHLYQRQRTTYVETCSLTLQLSKSFTTLTSQGFCRPPDPTEDQEEQSGKLESGTGLGDGEGAEDISKDVQDDEDLSELAQTAQKEEKDTEIEDTEGAVDMGNDDLEGEMGDFDENKSDHEDVEDRSGDEDENEIDEEEGSVDDLDPNAVDEKMWDDMKNESEKKDKEMKNDKAKGQKSDDQTAAEGGKAEDEDMDNLDGNDEEMEEDADDGGERREGEQMDAHVDEEKALELPEELNLAGGEETKDDDISDDGMDELSDIDNPAGEIEDDQLEDSQKQDLRDNDMTGEDDADSEKAEAENGVAQDDEVMEDQAEETEEGKQVDRDTRQDETAHDIEENVDGESGAANEKQDNVGAEQNVEGVNQADKEPNPQQSQPGEAPENEEEGKTGKGVVERGIGQAEPLEDQQTESLRKLADVLDQWHQRREILPASERQDRSDQDQDVDMADADFEHVQEEDAGDTQALGAAGVEQAQNLDQSKAVEDDHQAIDEDTMIPDVQDPEVKEDIAERYDRLKAQLQSTESKENGAFLPDRQVSRMEHDGLEVDAEDNDVSDDLSPDIEHLDLSTVAQPQIQASSHPTSATNAAHLWHQCSNSTHQFSLVLTEQLRLILSPTTATKLRGDFRTGKRLNIKRIIPYIASNYKRDKIWMRRSVPSKRNYQIMIAVDDSKSMSESGADVLAFETLALVTKALAMLEVGDLCVVGFGDQPQITIAHPFGTPFSPSESGPTVFQAFGFDQRGTDVKSLVEQSISLFRDARLQRQGANEEQWQLQLIVSDGHISSNQDTIARLVRRAHDIERIVIVFVIVDAGAESILDLKEAVYEADESDKGGEMKLRIKRYLDGFPFPYYLVVRDVRDLPDVLATALKGWFGSVVDVA